MKRKMDPVFDLEENFVKQPDFPPASIVFAAFFMIAFFSFS